MKKKASATKEKIKKAAITLFNEEDTLSVTTNHIAQKAHISPGNLYYYYKNKEAIIKEIYLEMSETFESFKGFESIPNSQNPVKTLSSVYDQYSELFWDYRFLMRDSAVLIRIYPEIKEIFLKKQEIRITQIESLLSYFIEEKIMKNIPPQEITQRAKLNWFIAAYWQIFASSSGKVTKNSIKEAKELVFTINIKPLLTPKGKMLLQQISSPLNL